MEKHKNRPHVLIFPSWYPTSEIDFVGSFFREQAIELKKRECKIGVIYPRRISIRRVFNFYFKSHYKSFDESILFSRGYINWFPDRFVSFFPCLKKFVINKFISVGHDLFKFYIMQNGIPDLIHCHSINYSGYLAEYISKKYKIPFVITEHIPDYFDNNPLIDLHEISRILNNSSKCLAVSKSFSEKLYHLIPNSPYWEVHHNLVSPIFLEAPISEVKKDPFVFITVSFLSTHKNTIHLLKSFSLFLNFNKNSILKIVGTGFEKENLVSFCENSQIMQNVIFLENLSRERTLYEINNSNCFLLSSLYEPFGVVLIEALALGKPIISTISDGPKDIVTDDVGILVPQNDINAFVEAMIRLYDSYENFNPYKLRSFAEEKFGPINISEKLINHYSQILKI